MVRLLALYVRALLSHHPLLGWRVMKNGMLVNVIKAFCRALGGLCLVSTHRKLIRSFLSVVVYSNLLTVGNILGVCLQESFEPALRC